MARKSADGYINQHKMMAEGDGLMKSSDFGVSKYPGSGPRPDPNKGIEGKVLSESERAVGQPMKRGKGEMGASRNPDHGPHDHFEAI